MMEPQAQEELGNSRQIESDYVKIVLYPIYLPIIDKLEIWGTNELEITRIIGPMNLNLRHLLGFA
jgi:hypothetical protein